VGRLVREQLCGTLGWPHRLETMALLYFVISSDTRIVGRVLYQDLSRSHFAFQNKWCGLDNWLDVVLTAST